MTSDFPSADSPFRSPQNVEDASPQDAQPLTKGARRTCVVGFWVAVLHAALLAFMLVGIFIVWKAKPRRPDDLFDFLALFIWEYSLPLLLIAVLADVLAALAFYLGRTGRSPWRMFAIYTALCLFLLVLDLVAAGYLYRVGSITFFQRNMSSSSTSLYGMDTFAFSFVRSAFLALPLFFVILGTLLQRFRRPTVGLESGRNDSLE